MADRTQTGLKQTSCSGDRIVNGITGCQPATLLRLLGPTGGGGPSKEVGGVTADWTLPGGTGHAHRSEEKPHWNHITHCTKAEAPEGRPEGRRGDHHGKALPATEARRSKAWSTHTRIPAEAEGAGGGECPSHSQRREKLYGEPS
ncbi:hypothetical protein EYF80_066820 [Liparis tanakae]|uniref:Uncharacterized protein n=1 Tax=Liparis tanakae TaxID=230148 RepID=A0A4Z2E2V8_9TELE|nr:hypothetical protein EYF80_066820 [Liparis tanakae]